MDDAKKLQSAQTAYKTLLKTLDSIDWKYKKDDEKMRIVFSVKGDDLPMDFIMIVDADRQLIRLVSFLPFSFPQDKRIEGAMATSQINYKLADGSFDYDISDGETSFRLTSSFLKSLISEKLLRYMVQCAIYTVDEYNDKLFMLSKGAITLSEFVKGFE